MILPFGLNAFKVLADLLQWLVTSQKETGKDVSELPYSVLTSEQLRKEFGQATFFTATDGNHGRGVAWAANRLGQKAVVHMPKGTTQTRLQNIAKEGAQVDIQELNYDDCVRLAAKEADETLEALSYRILHGTATKRSRHGSCRDTAPWQWKLVNS